MIDNELNKIIKAKVNNEIVSEVDSDFRIKYRYIKLEKPMITENFITRKLYPNECRIRNLTYNGNL